MIKFWTGPFVAVEFGSVGPAVSRSNLQATMQATRKSCMVCMQVSIERSGGAIKWGPWGSEKKHPHEGNRYVCRASWDGKIGCCVQGLDGFNHQRPIVMKQVLLGIQRKIAFVFDIDGVLLRGHNAIPRAKEALGLLNANKVPFILLTNGGGLKEKERVEFLSLRLDVDLSPLQLVQLHTPMKTLVPEYQRVMVVGGVGDKARACALDYGFRDVVMPVDLVKVDPAISPHHRYTALEIDQFAKPVDLDKPVEALLMFNDPRDLNTDLQVVMDVLNLDRGRIGTKRAHLHLPVDTPAVPLIFSNNDFLWANDYPLPRFGQGATRMMVERLYAEQNHGAQLVRTILGKPFGVQYSYAHHVLIDWDKNHYNVTNSGKTNGETESNSVQQVVPRLGQCPQDLPFDAVYMVGDNPALDIKGANDYGWELILLRTGVFRDEDWHDMVARPTVGVFNDVYDSIVQTLKDNGY